jgi:hypothetical protein
MCRLARAEAWISKQIYYNLIIRFLFEGYIELSIGALLQVLNVSSSHAINPLAKI